MKHRCMRPLGSRFSAKTPKAESVVVALAATAILPGFFAARPALAQQQPVPAATTAAQNAEPLVSLDLRDARLEQAIALLAQKSGFNIVTEPSLAGRPYGLVNVKLEDKPVSVVLRTIAAAAGAVVFDEDGIYHLRPRTEADANPAPKPLSPPVETAVVTPDAAPAPKRKVTQMTKIKLIYLAPIDFIRSLDDPTWLTFVANRAPEVPQPVQFKPITDTSVNFINAPANGGSVPVTPVTPSTPSSGTAGTTAGRDGDTYNSAGQRGLGGGGGRGGFGGGQGGFGLGGGQFGGQPGGGQPGGGLGGQNGGQASLRPAGIQNLIASDADNSLIVDYDDVEDLQRLREIVKLLDVAPKQVIIKAEFVSVGIQDADSFGVDWNITAANNINAVIPPAAGTTPTITLAYASGNAVANLRAALTRNTSNILQAPIISTTNNRPAQISVSRTITIQITQNIATNNGIISNSTPVGVTASNQLSVTPHINGDNSISMTLTPQLNTITPTANNGFTSDFQGLTTTRRVQNGETMVLGGFITKNETIALTKVPLLSDLPIIGNLFTQRDRTVNGSEVLIFITPTIIEDRAQGTVGTLGGSGSISPAPTP